MKISTVRAVLCTATILSVVYLLIPRRKETKPKEVVPVVPVVVNDTVFSTSKLQWMTHHGLNKSLKTIVLWTRYFGTHTWYIPWVNGSLYKEISCTSGRRCVLSVDRTNPLSYDALLFHGRDSYTVPKQRHPNQVYAVYLWESPVHGAFFVKGGNFYNWTSTYSKQSDIVMNHGSWFRLPQRDEQALQTLPQLHKGRLNGTATVLWIVSACHSSSGRRHYVEQLKCYIKVDVYGGCGKPCPNGATGNSHRCYKELAKQGQYKFYLAFENSECPDYISLKPYRALNHSMVPIVLGGTTAAEYNGLFPPNAYLDVRNFTSPQHLAEYLHYLDTHQEAYLAYHAWRTDHWVQASFGPTYCQVCDALYNNTMMEPRNVNFGEFWSPRKCRHDLVKQLIDPSPPNITLCTPV